MRNHSQRDDPPDLGHPLYLSLSKQAVIDNNDVFTQTDVICINILLD